jgi:hypothetical protein
MLRSLKRCDLVSYYGTDRKSRSRVRLTPIPLLYALNRLSRPDIMKSAFVLLGLALAALKATGIPQSPPVKVSLRSSWPSPPLLAEIL